MWPRSHFVIRKFAIALTCQKKWSDTCKAILICSYKLCVWIDIKVLLYAFALCKVAMISLTERSNNLNCWKSQKFIFCFGVSTNNPHLWQNVFFPKISYKFFHSSSIQFHTYVGWMQPVSEWCMELPNMTFANSS